ncbi:hypothetical protein, partial [Microvirga tunisiensis]|uniref:hypothetical protein n=1 Tax=Microvirga tunisiensis TaxID=2108360 RepID=UPI0030B89D9A
LAQAFYRLAHGSPDEFIRAIGYFSGRLKSSASRVPPHYSGPTTYSEHAPVRRSSPQPAEPTRELTDASHPLAGFDPVQPES